jgi:hypothetical protein
MASAQLHVRESGARCRVCSTPTISLWDLGSQSVVGFPTLEDPPLLKARLEVVLCPAEGCGLVQLRDTVPAEWLFREQYWYRSGTNEMMVRILHDVVDKALARQPLAPGDWVMDIGANDGTLLKHYPPGTCRVAVEPSKPFDPLLVDCSELFIPEFFPVPAHRDLRPKLITACAMAYDLEDPLAFFTGVRDWLHPEGLFVLQLGYLGDLFGQSAFDSICHEHLEYYSLTSLVNILARVGLTIYDVEHNDTNGGSIRCYVRRSDYTQDQPVMEVYRMLNAESALGFTTPEPWRSLRPRVEKLKAQVHDAISTAARRGPVDCYGASTKGLTLLQTWGLDSTQLRCVAERAEQKLGRYYGATGIPIVGEAAWRQAGGSMVMVLPWHFQRAVIAREAEWLFRGGAMLFPLPKTKVIQGPQDYQGPQA